MFVDFIQASKVVMVILALTVFICLYKAVSGPDIYDRIISINVAGTKVVVMLALLSVIFEEAFFVDLALIYVLLIYIGTLAIIKYLRSGDQA